MPAEPYSILIVDDEPEILKVLKKSLEDDFNVVVAHRAKEALNMIDHRTAVIISDQRMPEMTGSEFFKIVREKHPDVVRIMMSGYSDMNALINSVNQGEIFRYVSKPWELDALQEVVRLAVEKHEELVNHRKLIDENKLLIERNQDVASRLSQAMDELRRLKEELEKRRQS